MQRLRWVDRTFNLGIPPGWLPNVLTRLAGTGPRLKHLTEGLTNAQLSHQPNGKWSVKEQIGHLIDLETLHSGRVQDFIERKPILRAADMSNKKTYAANHNDRTIDELINEFKLSRKEFIISLKSLDDATQEFVATHPRLEAPMRAVDMAFFTAEHDDHHITSIIELLEYFT